MKGKSALLAGVAAFGLSAFVPAASAADAPAPTNAELAARMQALEDELQAYEEKGQSDHNRLSALEQNFNDTSWSFDNARPTVKSGDGRFTLSFRARFQTDIADFMQENRLTNKSSLNDLGSGAVVRRAYFGIEGKAFKDFWYEFRLNGGGSDGGGTNGGEGDPLVNIARIQYNGIDNFRINLGVIEPIQSLDGSVSSGQLTFLERAEIENIAADAFGGGDSRRGIEMTFQKTDALMPGDNLIVSGALTGGKTGSTAGHGNFGDEQTQAFGRIAYRVWSDGTSNFQIGGSGGAVLYSGGKSGGVNGIQLRDRPEIRVDGTRLIDTGAINAKTGDYWGLDAAGNWENFYLGGEYMNFTVDRQASGVKAADSPNFSGWFVEGSWILTGETKTYSASAMNNEYGAFNAPKVANPFSLDGDSWGAWELAARYSDTDLDWHRTFAGDANHQAGISGGRQRIVAIGINWYLNQNIRMMLDDQIVNVNRLSGPAGSQVGQNMNIIGARFQFQM